MYILFLYRNSVIINFRLLWLHSGHVVVCTAILPLPWQWSFPVYLIGYGPGLAVTSRFLWTAPYTNEILDVVTSKIRQLLNKVRNPKHKSQIWKFDRNLCLFPWTRILQSIALFIEQSAGDRKSYKLHCKTRSVVGSISDFIINITHTIEGWNCNFGNTMLDWIKALLEWRGNAAGKMGPSPTYIHNGSGPSRNGHAQ